MFVASFFLLLLSATLGTRKLLYQFTPGFHEYEAIFVYASDIFLILFLILSFSDLIRGSKNLFRLDSRFPSFTKVSAGRRGNDSRFLSLSLVAFLLVALVSIFFAYSPGLAFYSFARFVLVVLMAFAVARVVQNPKIFRAALAIIAVVAIFQSLIGILQFKNQQQIGLKWLGESPISVTDGKTSKILVYPEQGRRVEGVRAMRAYGLFPHPNILGAFLVMGLLALIYFLISDAKETRIHANDANSRFRDIHMLSRYVGVAISIFIVLLGLALTFSRSAWFAGVVGLVFFLGAWLVRERRIRPLLRLLVVLVASGYALVAILGWAILPRATVSVGEPAVDLRLQYNRIAFELIREHPFGVGIGNQVLHSVKNGVYREFGLDQVWQWQPIHNIYLLAFLETGVLGGMAFIVFLLCVLFGMSNGKFPMSNQFSNAKMPDDRKNSIRSFGHWSLIRNSTLEIRISQAMLLAFLVFGLFDHFFWTIEQGRLMLWLAIGFMLAARGPGIDEA